MSDRCNPAVSRVASRTSRCRGLVPGALAAVLSVASFTGAARAATLADAQAAFDRRDYADAVELWRELARSGLPEASFQLGLVSDLGLGVAPDPDEAFRRYLEAAERGHAGAQFNVGVMLDSGTGPLSSPSAAATWYARAAAKGFARAEYNLALMYTDGNGVPRNIGLAEAWLSRAAATLSAAGERLEKLRAVDRVPSSRPSAPVPLGASVLVGADGRQSLELVWTASEQPPGTRYFVELDGESVPLDADRGEPLAVSATVMPLPDGRPREWRVLAFEGDAFAVSDWQPLFGGEIEPRPAGTVAIRFGPDDARARDVATTLAENLMRDGLEVDSAEVGDVEIVESGVRYFFSEDERLAREVASSLPLLSGQAVFWSDPGREPGTVEVRLRGGSTL